MIFADSTTRRARAERTGERNLLQCGNFFNPTSPSFLGGGIGQTVAEVGLGAFGMPYLAAGIGAAAGAGSGGFQGALLGGLQGYGAGSLGDTVSSNIGNIGNYFEGTQPPAPVSTGVPTMNPPIAGQLAAGGGIPAENVGAGQIVPNTPEVYTTPYSAPPPVGAGTPLPPIPAFPAPQQLQQPTGQPESPVLTPAAPAAPPPSSPVAPGSAIQPVAAQLASATNGAGALPWQTAAPGSPGFNFATAADTPLSAITANPVASDPSIWQRIQQLMPDKSTMGTINTIGNLGSTAYGLYNANQIRQQAQGLDAMAPYRAGYAAQLAALQANPGSVTSLPGYQFGMDQGSQALQRAAAAQGYTGSGNAQIALQQYGQNYANQYLQQQQQYLAGLAGGSNPASVQGTALAAQLAGQSLGSLGYGLNRQYGASS